MRVCSTELANGFRRRQVVSALGMAARGLIRDGRCSPTPTFYKTRSKEAAFPMGSGLLVCVAQARFQIGLAGRRKCKPTIPAGR
jgi:hypothetical protein